MSRLHSHELRTLCDVSGLRRGVVRVLTVEDGTASLSRNVGKWLPTQAAGDSGKPKALTRNHAGKNGRSLQTLHFGECETNQLICSCCSDRMLH
jgi:hypothetical protein